ncbi:cupin domain-containing protein [Microbacterium sp. P01]|uniref:cupin domain-containing protein n=1 Tax=unclassified Microbacterium TaxID=2609290 RepID=UPI00366B7F01
MSERLVPGEVTDAAQLTVPFETVAPAQVVAGTPGTRYAPLDEASGVSIGVWEMSAGAMSDVEADEVFVVLAGDATVEFIEPALPPIELRPGSIVRLEQGMRTVWTVRDTLRKVFVAG